MIAYFGLVFALSLDTFMAALSYESNRIKIPLCSNFIISFICSLVLLISLLFGGILDLFISNDALKWVSFVILFLIGLFKVFDNLVKKIISKGRFKGKCVNFSFCNLKFILQVYSDYSYADADKSKYLSPTEAISLALALSIDGLSAGLAFNVDMVWALGIFLVCFLVNVLFILMARWVNSFSNSKFNLSFLGGFIFIILAFCKL